MTEPGRLLRTVAILLSALAVLELLALALVRLYVVPAFVVMFRDLGGPLPASTQLVLSHWWTPACALLVVTVLLGGWLGLREPKGRVAILSVALVMGAAALAWTVVAMYLPIFALAGSIQ